MTNRSKYWYSGAAIALLFAPLFAGCDSTPNDPFEAAQAALANGEPRTALDLIGVAIDEDPNNPALRMVAGDAAMALHSFDRAIAEYERVAEGSSDYALARAKLAEAQLSANYMQAASETVSELIMDNSAAYNSLIAFHFAQGDSEAGFAELDKGLAAFPDDPRLVTIDAERLWARGRADETFARLEAVLSITPAIAEAHLFAGQLRIGQRDVIEAQAHFEKVLSVRPTHETAMFALAAIAQDRGDTQTAQNWINKASETGAPHPIGLLFAAQMAYDAGNVARAFELIERAPSAIASEPQFSRLRGLIDAARDQHAMAALALSDYVEETGGDPLARQVLAKSLAEQGQLAEAWTAIEPIVDHPQIDGTGLLLALSLAEQTGQSQAVQIRALIERRNSAPSIGEEMREAGAAIRAGDWDEADRIYAPLLAGAARTNPALLNNAAAVKTRLGEHSQAVELARRALAEAPTSPEIMDTLGWALWEQGGAETEARDLLTRARQGAPNNREIAEHWNIAHAS